ncbi:hypothetical protein DFH06DRAFT_974493 [Mycena polygramma]|nr:hypothetical protein DFH06DRAFT_974493 [Mycena polygramma]
MLRRSSRVDSSSNPSLLLLGVSDLRTLLPVHVFKLQSDQLSYRTSPSTPQENSELSVVLMCLPTYAVRALSESLAPTNPTAETMATAVAGLKTSWPENGMLFLDMNVEGSRGKTWLPYDIDPASPLDVTKYIQPGPNVIRFIQLTSMEDRTFILYASRREREPTRSLPDPVSDFFGNSAGGQSDNPLFDFSPTVTVSNS